MRHAPPAVRHPVNRPAAGAAPAALASLAAVAAVAAWTLQAPAFDLRQAAAGAACAAAAAWAFLDWCTAPRGWLAWDGASWSWHPRSAAAEAPGAAEAGTAGGCGVRPTLHLDLQALLLLRLRAVADDGAPCPRWLWLERGASPATWHDLRRAVLHAAGPADAARPLPTDARADPSVGRRAP
ncbi:MAG: hypothetical protein PGN26_14940 [Xylophilus ampelinus]